MVDVTRIAANELRTEGYALSSSCAHPVMPVALEDQRLEGIGNTKFQLGTPASISW